MTALTELAKKLEPSAQDLEPAEVDGPADEMAAEPGSVLAGAKQKGQL